MNDLVGRTFGRWVVEEPLPHGGWGALYKARSTDTADPRAAIRFIDAPDDTEIHRTEAEYQLLRAQPTNVVTAYDCGIAELGRSRAAYLVIERPELEPLSGRLPGAVSIREAHQIGAEIALALLGVHHLRFAHLDLKPANILVGGLSAKLAGFGAAQPVGAAPPALAGRARTYLAPEQLDPAAPVTCASDIYALGVTLFELCTREPVLDLARVDPRPALRRHGVPQGLSELIARMLAPDPAARPSAAEVGRSLIELAASASPPKDPWQGPVSTGRDTGSWMGSPPPPQHGPLVARDASPIETRTSGLWSRVVHWFGTAKAAPMPMPIPAPVIADTRSQPTPSTRNVDQAPPRRGGASPNDSGASHSDDGDGSAVTGGASVSNGGASAGTDGSEAEADGSLETTGPVAFGADDLGDPTPESIPGGKTENAGLLFWNIAFPGNDAVRASRVLIAGTPYALETALQAAQAAQSFSKAKVDAASFLGNASEVPVKFVIEARGARVRAQGAQDWLASVASSGLTCRATGTDVFRAEVQASGSGPVAVTVTLHVRGAITLREVIALQAVGVPDASSAADGAPPADRADAAPEPEPDAEVSVAAIEAAHEASLVLRLEPFERWYALRIAAGGVEDSAVLHTCATTAELAKEAVLARKKLVALSKRYRVAPPRDDDAFSGLRPADDGEAMLEIARIGRRLHGLIFGEPEENVPLDLARVADLIRGHGQRTAAAPRMQIDAETLPFPWGIVYDAPGALDRVADVALHGFWGRRFMIDRAISAILRSLPPPVLEGAIQPCLNPHLDSEESLQVIASQRGFFERIGRTSAVRSVIESGDQLRAYLQDEGVGAPAILYFFCHARAAHEMSDQLFQIAAAADEQASLLLDASGSKSELSVGELKRLRRSPLKARPLVFLNACSSAEADQYYQSQFLTLFVSQWQARAFIGSDWKIPTEFADAFARRALDRFLAPAQRLELGAALHATAVEVLELGNPFPLIYALYGRPELLAA